MRYPHYIEIQDPTTATIDDETGRFTSPQSTVVYTGRADVQDGGVVISRDEHGTPTELADAEVFLPNPHELDIAAREVQPEMIIEVLWNPYDVDLTTFNFDNPPGNAIVQAGTVQKVRNVDSAIFISLGDPEGS